jgi:hypothetical protein
MHEARASNATKGLIAAAVLALVVAIPVGRLYAAEPGEVQIGPVEYQQNVNGVPVNVTATTFVKVESKDNKIQLNARVVGDFIDLQRKIGAIVDTFDLPRDNCRSYSPNNPVVSIPRKELAFKNGSAMFTIGGSVVMWQCLENPIPNSRVDWEIRDVGFGIKTKVPVVRTWPGSPIKTILVTQPFNAELPVSLFKSDDHSVGLQFSKPDIELTGQFAFITKGVLKIANVDINEKAYDALRKAIDPTKLRLTIPDEVSKFNPVVVSARFTEIGGHLAAEIRLSAEVPAAVMTDLIKELLNRPRT